MSIVVLVLGGLALLLQLALFVPLGRRRQQTAAAIATALFIGIGGAILVPIAISALKIDALKSDSLYFGMLAGSFVGATALGALAMKLIFPLRDAGSAPARKPGTAAAARVTTPAPRSAASSAPDVFISYKRDERGEVLAIVRRLEALKLRVWFDAEMRSGTTFDSEIDRQVRSARAVLVCWSPGAVESDWVRGEATIGRQRGVLAAAMLKPCDLPAPFNLVHAENLINGIGPQNPEWLQLVERLGSLVGRPGLAAFEELENAADRDRYATWIAAHSADPLLDAAVARLKAL